MNHQPATFASAKSHVTEQDDEIDLDALAPVVQPTRKRAVETDGNDSNAARKKLQSQKSDHEKRLMGNYEYPKSAKPIDVPTYSGGAQEMPRRSGTKAGGGFKPMNTLSSSPHASKGNSIPDIYKSSLPVGGRTAQGKLNTTRSVGGNVAANSVTDRYGDGFEDGGRNAKRQKVTHEGRESHPVDLTNLNDGVGMHVPRSTMLDGGSVDDSRAVSHASSAGNKASKEPSHLKNLTWNLTGQPKSRRRPKNDRRASQASQTPSIVEVEGNGIAQRGTSARNTPVVIDHSDENGGPASSSSSIRRTIDQTGTVAPTPQSKTGPQIDLTKGFDDLKVVGMKRSNGADKKATNSVLNALLTRNNLKARSAQTATAVTKPSPRSTAELRDGSLVSDSTAALHGRQQPRAQSPKLSQKFQRDTEPPLPPRSNAKHRMKDTSERPPPKVRAIGDSSEDELQGSNTVIRQASRSISPWKSPARTQRQSPSDIKATKFTSSRGLQESGERPRLEHDDHEEAQLDSDVLPITAFFALSCVLTGKGVSLRYDTRGPSIDVYDGDAPAVVPGKKRTVSIGPSEARDIHHNNKSNHVYVRGSRTDVSNGHICIAFNNSIGFKWFLDRIALVTNDRQALKHETLERMDQMFRYQCQQIDIAANRAKDYARRETVDSMDGRRGRESAGSEDGEEIKYEDDKEPAELPKRRKMMLGGNDQLVKTSQHPGTTEGLPERSPYFSNPGTTRRSTRQRKPVDDRPASPSPERWSKIHNPKPWAHPVVYPPSGARRVTVEFGDLERLDEGQFLNDNIVSFALRRIEKNMAPEHKDSVHFFNSFFYPSFTTKNGKKTFNYDAVKRWTKNKDIFTIPYIVVPICIDLHWFVAIICNLPNLSRKMGAADEESEPPEEVTVLAEPDNVEEIDDSADIAEPLVRNGQARDETAAMHELTLSSDGGEAAGVAATEELDVSSSRRSTGSSRKSKKKKVAPVRRFDPDSPAIVTLDSFGNAHNTEVRNLKDYLTAEAEEKRNMALNREMLQGVTAKGIPEQTNFCDCGVYLIGYVEQFAANPRRFVTKALGKELDQQADFASFNPSAKRAEIRDELLRMNIELEEAHIAKKKQKKAAHGAAARPANTERDKPNESKAAQAVSTEKAPVAAAAGTAKADVKELSQARAEKHKPTPMPDPKPPAKIATSAGEQDDADELEMSPARPLGPPVAAGHPQRAQLGKPRGQDHFLQEESSESSEEEVDEMLDNNNGDREAHAIGSTAAQAGSSDTRLLDDLQRTLSDNPMSPGKNAVPTPSPVAKQRTSQSRSPTINRRTGHSSRQALKEVPDSQEARPAPYAPIGQGKHIKFDD